MKTFMQKSLIAVLALAALVAARAQQEQRQPADDAVPVTLPTVAATEDETGSEAAEQQQQAVSQLIQAVVDAAAQGTNGEQSVEGEMEQPGERGGRRPIRGQGTRGTTGSGTNAISLSAFVAQQATNHTAGATQMLRLNFRNAPLSMVLDYLSDAAGFTISANSKVDLKGTITVWSNRPVTRDEAIRILDESLTASGYGATVEGNLLNVFVVDATNTRIIAGIPNNDYTNIPATKEMVTQIVYVHNVEAAQLITSLQPLMPSGTSMTANQGANAIVITDTKTNIRRMAQLVKALDTASVSAASVEVFPLKHADATAMAQVVNQLFQGDSSSSRSSTPGFPFFPGGFPGRDRGSSRGDSSGSTQAGRMAASKVIAVADDRSNSLVVSASQDQMALVRDLVEDMDVDVDELTEVRVFRLQYADPQETADQIANLFPDPTTQQTASSRSSRFSGPFPVFRDRSSSGNSANQSTRKTVEARVTAVPDPRTGSVIVTASHDMMTQIANIIAELDSDPAKKKKVYVIKVENRDPQDVVEELQSVISTDSSGSFNNSRSTLQQSGSQLNTRQQNNLRNQGSTAGSSMNNSSRSRSSP